jgi:hypothetical protein
MRCGDEHRWNIGGPARIRPSVFQLLQEEAVRESRPPRPLFPKEANMSAKQRRKVYGIRRETRRPRGWTRWFHEGMLEAENTGSVRLRTTLWGKNSG